MTGRLNPCRKAHGRKNLAVTLLLVQGEPARLSTSGEPPAARLSHCAECGVRCRLAVKADSRGLQQAATNQFDITVVSRMKTAAGFLAVLPNGMRAMGRTLLSQLS